MCQSEHATHLCPYFGYLSSLLATICLDGRGRREAREGWIVKGGQRGDLGLGVCVRPNADHFMYVVEKMAKNKKKNEERGNRIDTG